MRTNSTHKTVILTVALLVALALPMVAGAANKLVVNGTDGTTPKMVVTDTGYVGVGTNAPIAAIQTKGSTFLDTQIISHYAGSDPTGGGGFIGYRNTATGTLPLAGNRLGYFLFGSMDGTTPKNAAGLSAYAETNWTSTSTPSYFLFETVPNGAFGRIERMRITSSGNVGIGTGTPTQKIEINGGIRMNTVAAKPTCEINIRGTLWHTKRPSGVADNLEVCIKDASDNYVWQKLF